MYSSRSDFLDYFYMKYKKFELKLKDGFKVAEKSIYELNKIIDISSKILPQKANRLALFKRQIKEELINDKDKGSSQQLISVAARILGLLFLLDADIFEEKVLLQEWFNRLIVDLLFEIKFNFYKIPTEFIEKLNQLKSSIELKYPKFYNSILKKFLTYEYDSMFFPYQTKSLTFNQYYEDLNFVPIKELKKVGDSRKVYAVITFFSLKIKNFKREKNILFKISNEYLTNHIKTLRFV